MTQPTPILLALGSLVLALHPLVWLAGTWIDPAYESAGGLVAACVAALILWSLSSNGAARGTSSSVVALGLAGTALVRLLAQVLAIHVLGALALAVDVWLVGRWLGLDRRVRPLAPLWLAVSFALSLPIERLVQRVLGFALQGLSAEGACAVLALGGTEVRCDGVAITYGGAAVLVDLPCSGAGGLTLQLVLFATLAALTRPSFAAALVGLAAALAGALAGNILRVAVLAAGQGVAPVDLFAEPWHSVVGLGTLGVGAVPTLLWARSVRPLVPPVILERFPIRLENAPAAVAAAVGFLVAAVAIVVAPAHPADVSRSAATPRLPAVLAGLAAAPQALSPREQAYFTQFGGGAARAGYGEHAVLVVSTAAPLRHLHAPDECLTGAGHQVRYLGQADSAVPAALYRSTDPAGRSWRVLVTFVSDRGEAATSVAQAVWRWLHDPAATWTMVERVSPWDGAPADSAFEAAVIAAFDLPRSSLKGL